MRLFDFISSLLPRLGKEDVLEDLRLTSGELDHWVVEAYTDAGKYFKSAKMAAPEAKDLSTVFYRNFGSKGGKGNFLLEVESRLAALRTNLKFVNTENDDILERDIIKEGLTAKKAILVRAAEQFSFLTRYSLDLLNYVYIQETKAAGGEVNNVVPVEEKHITANIANFARLLAIYGDSPESFKKHFDALPDVVLNANTYESLAAVYREDKLDPLNPMLIKGFDGNPVYHFRLMISEWQANRYKTYKDKKRVLELRVLNLKMLNEKTQDPKVEKEIEYIEARIEGFEYKMKKMEESVS